MVQSSGVTEAMSEPQPEQLPSPSILSLDDLDRALARLPARQRARLRWTRPLIEKVLHSIQTAMPTPEALVAGVSDLYRVGREVIPLVKTLRGQVGDGGLADGARQIAGVLGETVSIQLGVLRAYLPNESAGDSAEWALRAVVEGFRRSAEAFALAPSEEAFKGTDEAHLPALAQSETAGLVRAQLLLMALLDAAATPRVLSHAADLAHLACLEALRGVRGLRRERISVDPYADEPTEARNARVVRTIQQLREGMTEDFHAAIFPSPSA